LKTKPPVPKEINPHENGPFDAPVQNDLENRVGNEMAILISFNIKWLLSGP
jgi:hypothetical protein